MLPNDEEAARQLTDGGWLYVLRDTDRAGSAVVRLLVDDLDERLAAISARGIEPGPVRAITGKTRSSWITDPDGNRIQIGQPG
jgi:predicted enzyme related to lactoylglutathione lyase